MKTSSIEISKKLEAEVHDDEQNVSNFEVKNCDSSFFESFEETNKQEETENASSENLKINKNSTVATSCESSKKLQLSKLPERFRTWQASFKWLTSNKLNKTICSCCTEASQRKLLINLLPNELKSHQSFVENGFECWVNANKRFQSHQKGSLHLKSVQALSSLKNQKPVNAQIQDEKSKQMIKARIALEKIFESVAYLAKSGIALRGHEDSSSNFTELLELRAEDVPELKWWLESKDHRKWTSHDCVEEMLKLISNQVLRDLLEEIRGAKFYGLMIDETTDISRKEQVSFNVRSVLPDLTPEEYFLGFYEVSSTTAATLYTVIKDVLKRFNLPISDIRGQCYDGASNMSGHINGLQELVKKDVPRAVYVHCLGHNLNLVVQDGMQKISSSKNFLNIAKEWINFIRHSPKRLNFFKDIQSEAELDSDGVQPQLSPFCPTR